MRLPASVFLSDKFLRSGKVLAQVPPLFRHDGKGLRIGPRRAALRPKGTAMLSPQTLSLARYMDLLSFRQKITAANIANADTPGYRARDVDFQWEVHKALEGRSPTLGEPAVSERGGQSVNNDGNDVSLDVELRLLAETGIRFSLAAMLTRGNLRAVRSAIHEGRSA
jgi:flagellar basal-body rod protein FlgB